jgi:hypothetical protein
MTEKEWMDSRKILNAMSFVCKQNQRLVFSHLHENCMVILLEPRGSVPPSCDKGMVEISNSVLTQLTNNKWLNFVPTSESITVRCVGKPPVNVLVSAIGKLRKCANCKGFDNSALFQTHSFLTVDNPGYGSDCYEHRKFKIRLL